MKKFTLLCAAMVAAVMTAKAEVEFAYDAGAEIVSSYIWRGQYNGGLSFQPDAEVGFDALDDALEFRAGVWANIGASDWGFRKDLPYVKIGDVEYNPNTYFVPELDFMAHVTAYGASLGYNAYYYCNDGSDHTSELWFGYNFSHFFGEKAGAYINWYTTVGGGGDLKPETDLKQIAKGQLERQAFSTYIELGYDYTFEKIGLTLGAQIGLSPWESPIYGNDQFACTNLSLKVNKEWEFEHFTLDVFALGSLNPDGVNDDNAFVKASGDNKLGVQKLNGTIGVGIWF